MRESRRLCRLMLCLGIVPVADHAEADHENTRGILRVSAENPRYFADAEGRIVYLTGSHTWNNL